MPSLNDSLEIGPNLLPETVGCLLRFRLYEFALTCDGKQAFLRNATRFFWYKQKKGSSKTATFTDEVTTYRFTLLPFGLSCSLLPFCATTRELAANHINDFPTSEALLDKHLYMDDFVVSLETESQIMVLQKEVKDLMSLIKLSMEKWATDSLKLQHLLEANKENFKTETTVLCIGWNTKTDTLSNAFKTSLCAPPDKPLTKKWLLHCITSLYDPLGLFTPFTIIGKILFQDTWILGINWDEILPTNLAAVWHTVTTQLDAISSKEVPRFIGISSLDSFNIHIFYDASERVYVAVLYIVTSRNNQSSIHLVCSRNRLAPIRKVSLLRLELLAAVIGTRLLKFFRNDTGLSQSTATLWSYCEVPLG
ncbi:uncharacterized protein [Parasteatoda tepidariorum]|uniref:uncharacterized protein n=1 Tax=Parasteatoda tepidariorum TaxID=114398 RepID=UPI001C724CA2|nr:uncharacterized protein LOC107448755 [Parasteatoda tepidariorum]